MLLIGPLETNFSEMLIHIFSFKKMHLKLLPGKRQPFVSGLNVFNVSLDMVKWVINASDGLSHQSYLFSTSEAIT